MSREEPYQLPCFEALTREIVRLQRIEDTYTITLICGHTFRTFQWPNRPAMFCGDCAHREVDRQRKLRGQPPIQRTPPRCGP